MVSAPQQKIKVGFIGLSANWGWASETLGPGIFHPYIRKKYDLVAVSTTSEASAHASAEKYSKEAGHPIKAYYGDASKIASDPDVDLVAVSVKAPHHKEILLKVIEAKKNFFIEWPAGTSTEETEEISAAARRQGVRSPVGLQGRHAIAIHNVKELLASGVIGTVRSTNMISHFPREANVHSPNNAELYAYLMERKNGATIFSTGVGHQVDTLTHVLGNFVSLTATDAKFYPTINIITNDGKLTGKTFQAQNPDHFAITGLLETGVLANVIWRAGYTSSEGRFIFVWEIDREEGSIRLQTSHDKLIGAFPGIVEPELYLNGKRVEQENPGGVVVNCAGAWKAFADRTPGTYVTIEDAVKHHRPLDAIELSAKEGIRVTL